VETTGDSSGNYRCNPGVLHNRGQRDCRVHPLGAHSLCRISAPFYGSSVVMGEVSRSCLVNEFGSLPYQDLHKKARKIRRARRIFCCRIFTTETEVPMQKWPYANFAYINGEHFSSMPQKNAPAQKREYLMVQAVFVSDNAVMFFDHYAKEYKSQRSELDAYLEQLSADGWKLATAGGIIEGKGYQFRRYQFRRAIA
jgi:hypothetical protein